MDLDSLRIETERLILRPTRTEDFEGWAAMMVDPDVARFIGGVQPRHVAWRGFLSMAGAWAIQGFAMFSVIEKSSGAWLGRLGPWFPEGWPGSEVGWGLVRDAWGKGYATEGSAAAMDFVFDTLGWAEVIHPIDPDNDGSKRVASRLGSTLRGAGRLPVPLDKLPVEIWGQTREQWRQRRRSA
jgi:RimJ/RimL family protein N-acetyltransferase